MIRKVIRAIDAFLGGVGADFLLVLLLTRLVATPLARKVVVVGSFTAASIRGFPDLHVASSAEYNGGSERKLNMRKRTEDDSKGFSVCASLSYFSRVQT